MELIYYFTFRFVIRRFDVKTPGRTDVTANANDKSDSENLPQRLSACWAARRILIPLAPALPACVWKWRKARQWIKTA